MNGPAELLQALASQPWAMLQSQLTDLVTMAVSPSESRAMPFQGRDAPPRGSKSIAVIPIHGMMFPNDSRWFSAIGTKTIRSLVRAAANDSSISHVLLDIDSPGGLTQGTPELGAAVFEARKQKPVWAIANGMAASAAYWVGSQASWFFASPSSDVGSIGVYALHLDQSRLMEKIGLKATFIHAGKYKIEGNAFEPLSDEARAHLQESVEESYSDFLAAVAQGRGVKVNRVRSGFGEGRVVSAKRALKAGMIDEIATFDEVVGQMTGKTQSNATANLSRRRAEFEATRLSPKVKSAHARYRRQLELERTNR